MPQNNLVTDYDTYINNYKIKDLIKEILETEIDKLSISQAYDFLNKIQKEFSNLNCKDKVEK